MRKIKYISTVVLLSSILFFTGCIPNSALYSNNTYAYHGYDPYDTVYHTSRYRGIYNYPRYIDLP
jgi:hypothetical protein